jgi:hypothetical protein
MVINLNIQADTIDIKNDTPQKSDIFLVDTNVWFWQTYSNASTTAKPYQLRDYPNCLSQALENESTLSYSVLNLAELASLIERTESSIYNKSNGLELKLKEYRHNYPNEEAISRAGTDLVQVITDGMDYATVPNIQVFTSNNRVIQLARVQGKLLNR